MLKSFIFAGTSIAYIITAATTSNAGMQTRKNNNTGCVDRQSLTGRQHASSGEFSLSANDVKAICRLLYDYYANFHQKTDNPEKEEKFANRRYKEVVKIELVSLSKTSRLTKELNVFVTQNMKVYSWNSEREKWEIMPNATQKEITYKFIFEKKNEQWRSVKTEDRDTTISSRGEKVSN
jgi:hypothetical protein